MKRDFNNNDLRRVVLCCSFVAAVAVAVIWPFAFGPAHTNARSTGLADHTVSKNPDIPNYDIRTDKSAIEKLAAFRGRANKTAAAVADVGEKFVNGEAALRRRVPHLKVEYNNELRIPEVIGIDVQKGKAALTPAAANMRRPEILRNFLGDNPGLTGVSRQRVADLKEFADYTNPSGNLSFVELEQNINGVPVFQGSVRAAFAKSGEMVRVVNNLAPDLDETSVSADFGYAAAAVQAAAKHLNYDVPNLDITPNAAADSENKEVFGIGDSATTAEKMYFPTEPGVAVPAWLVLIWEPVNAYYVVVDAASGELLWRKNITDDQTQSAIYSVYTNPNAMINVAENPFPFTPGPSLLSGVQGAAISKTLVTRVGNEAPYTFNNNGWITDGGTKTDGNAIQAGLDRDGTDGVDFNSEAVAPNRNFNFAYTPFDPNTNAGDTPVPSPQTYPGSQFQQGSITQMFYICNWYHDELYRLGFTESARNFQHDNFGRGGLGNDRVRGEGQDSSGTNNANFSTNADGNRPRMQMYLWTGPNPDIDGNLDAEVMIHEYTHGLSNRLHGNSFGLALNMSSGMGEGWSDFYAQSVLSQESDPLNGVYAMGGYDTYKGAGTGYTTNYYYGIRRFPKAIMSSTGGPNNRPHNPLTFADADSTKFNVTDGAFARGPFGSVKVDQVHNLGEIWSSALWEIRAKYIARLGWAEGNRRVLQHVTDGMKLAPLSPTFLTERDAIVAAALAGGTAADVADIWAGFAIRGMGATASIQNVGTGENDTRVTEAFDLPNVLQSPSLTASDASADNDGFLEPGETVTLNIPLTNSTGNLVTGVSLQVNGGTAVNYGNVAHGQTVSQAVSFSIPADTPCGSTINLVLSVSDSVGNVSFNRQIFVGAPGATLSAENFDGNAAPAFPAGWTAASVQSGIKFVTSTAASDSAPNAAFAAEPTSVGGGTDLTSPVVYVTSGTASVTFRHRFNTEQGWDGGALEISVAGGPFQDILTAGGSFTAGAYSTGVLGGGVNNPLAGHAAWHGDSGGYITTTVQLPAATSGKLVQLKWRFGADDNTAGSGANPGWFIDSISLSGAGFVSNFNCSTIGTTTSNPAADFDGDSKTDTSFYRPSDGNWYLNRSRDGAVTVQWGNATDIPAPADFDNDGKADIAVFRPSTGQWLILRSSDSGFVSANWGGAGDDPVPGDYDGDRKADIAVYRPSNGTWYVLKSTDNHDNSVQWGGAGDMEVHGDYDGDGKTDIAVYRPSNGNWFVLQSSGGGWYAPWGTPGDKPTPADFDGDNKDDMAVYRPSDGNWYIYRSGGNGSYDVINWGNSTDTPVPGDYDGDTKDDIAQFRSSTGQWFILKSGGGFDVTSWGGAIGDKPSPASYIP